MSTLPHATIQFPANSIALQAFHQALEMLDPGRRAMPGQKPIEIRVLDVVPLQLDSVYVTVEKHLLRDLDEVQKKFGGGFNAYGSNGSANAANKLKGKDARAAYKVDAEERLRNAVREALAESPIIHTGDILPLPLPAHPITHVPPPPARVSFCQPVSQGLLMPTTKIVIVQARSAQARTVLKSMHSSATLRGAKSGLAEEEEDTSNEQFYSAAEDRGLESTTEAETTSAPEESEIDDVSSAKSGSDLSDDSLDDIISMSAPGLPPQASGTLSGMTSATPRPGLGRRIDGISTPGSIFSSFTSTTQRPGGRSMGKVFKAEGMVKRIPVEALHPKPRGDDDEDAMVFVDIHTLVKIGVFSGDWVKIEPAKEPQANPFAMLNFGFRGADADHDPNDWRAVKVYGLPGLTPNKPRYSMNRSNDRRSSVSQLGHSPLAPMVLIPPILHANLGAAKFLRLAPLPAPSQPAGPTSIGMAAPRTPGLSQSKGTAHMSTSSASLSPPVAKEANLIKLLTPLSIDLSLQQSLFMGLKKYFENKRRVVKSGDLVGISIDVGLGKAVFAPSSNPNPDTTAALEEEDLTSKLGFTSESQTAFSIGDSTHARKIGAAWFRIGSVIPVDAEGSEEDHERWGGVAVIDPSFTKTMQSRNETGRVPGSLESQWEYWLGVRSLSRAKQEFSPKSFAVEAPKPYASSLQQRLRDLIAAATSPRAIHLGMKPVLILLTSTQRNIGKATVAHRACADIGVHTFTIDGYDILAEGNQGGDVNTAAYFSAGVDRAASCGSASTALVIRHIEVLTVDRMVTAFKDALSELRVIIATTTDIEKIPEGMRSLFTHEMEMTAPDEKAREGILTNAVAEQGVRLAPDVDLGSVALKTAALVAGDLVDVVERAAAAKVSRLDKVVQDAKGHQSGEESSAHFTLVSTQDVLLSGGPSIRCVTKADFTTAIDAARKNFADSIGAPKIPNVTWDDVGGMTHIKDAVMETIQLPLERPELFAKGMKKRSGILFYGPPGTGKTLLAKAIATEFSLNFFSVKGPELLNMYIGESEANVRRVFQRARDARPCCVFFDELDSVAPKRGNQGDSGGVMDRIVSQLLAELDGMSGGGGSGDGADDDDSGANGGGGVFVIGATNRPDLLDPALLRPGRFDKMLYLGVSDTHEKQATILTALTRKFSMHPTVSLNRVAETLPFTYTGADLYALCSDAMLKAVTRKANQVDEKIRELEREKASGEGSISTAWWFDHVATDEDVAIEVQEEDFKEARKELVASVRYVTLFTPSSSLRLHQE